MYAFKGTESDDLTKDEKFLHHSLDSMYDLYLSILALLIELPKKSKDHNEKRQKKLNNKLEKEKKAEKKTREHLKLALLVTKQWKEDTIIARLIKTTRMIQGMKATPKEAN